MKRFLTKKIPKKTLIHTFRFENTDTVDLIINLVLVAQTVTQASLGGNEGG